MPLQNWHLLHGRKPGSWPEIIYVNCISTDGQGTGMEEEHLLAPEPHKQNHKAEAILN